MNASLRWIAPVLAVSLLAGCATHTQQVDTRAVRHVAHAPVPLTCAHRLLQVVDARAMGSASGALGNRSYAFPDASGFVRDSLAQSGFAADASSTAPGIEVRISQLYLTQNDVSIVPVAVYKVRIGDEPERLVRAQTASISFSASEQTAYDAYALAIGNANRQVVEMLNARCARNPATR